MAGFVAFDGPMLSVRSRKVVAARKLVRRTGRRRSGQILVEGPQALSVAVDRLALQQVFVTEAAASRHRELLRHIAATPAELLLIEDEVAAALSETVTPQGLIGVAAAPSATLADLPPAMRLVAVLVGPRDPGNLGTIIRTADAAGADAVLVTDEAADPFSGKAIRASAGSVFALPVVDDVSTAAALAALAERGVAPIATTGAGIVDLDTALDEGMLTRPTAWLFGTEATGLPAAVIEQAAASGGTSLRVPVYGAAESLNVAAAAAVCLYASARAQRMRAGEGVGG
jgi:TrmH family RNA methyltransferase